MQTLNFNHIYEALAVRYLGRELVPEDGLPETDVLSAERRLGHPLPQALRVYYLVAGRIDAFNTIHNELLALDALIVTEGYLLFMDENQSVVSWGLRGDELDQLDPIVWQRNNTSPVEWFSEEKRFTDFLASMLAWYREIDVWGHHGRGHDTP